MVNYFRFQHRNDASRRYINDVSAVPEGTPIPCSITAMTGLRSAVVDRYKSEKMK